MNIDFVKEKLDKKIYEKQFIENRLDEISVLKEKIEKELNIVLRSENVVIDVSKKIQEDLCFSIEEIVNMILRSCFDYYFAIDFVVKRGKTEIDMYIQGEDGDKIYPMDSSGGGVVDLISFGLRIALWALSGNKENLIILDEPFKYLSRDLLPKVSEMFKELNKKLGFQIIVVTHSELMSDMIEDEDKLFKVEKLNNISVVKEI